MDENDMQRAIDSLKKDLKTYNINKSSLILSIILLLVAFLGGGLLLGAIFKSVPMFAILSILAAVPNLSTKIKELEDVITDIKLTDAQIIAYGKEIEEIKQIRYNLAHPQNTEKTYDKPKLKYEYKGKDTEKSTSSDVKDIPIEFFDESDFLDDKNDIGHKKK